MTNKQPTYLNYAAISELRDQLGAKDQMIKELKKYCHELEVNKLDLIFDNSILKSLLKEFKHIMEIERDFASCHFEKNKLTELLSKTDEALK